MQESLWLVLNLILKWQLQLHWDWHWDWSVILELLILILWSHSAHIATEIGIDTESEKMAVIVLNIVKIFNLFNPYLSFCCSYVAKILNFAQYFLNTTETFADKHCIKEPRLILWLNFDWSFTEIETEAEVSILVIIRLKLMLNTSIQKARRNWKVVDNVCNTTWFVFVLSTQCLSCSYLGGFCL